MHGDDAAKGGKALRRTASPAAPRRRAAAQEQRARNAPDQDLREQIGQQLRAIYDEVVQQEVPDRFMKLLAELDEKTRGSDERSQDADDGGGQQR